MSPYLFSADLATISSDVRQLRSDLQVADIAATHEEHDGAEASEITTRFVAALRAHDTETEFELWRQAHDLDRAQPFGPRLVDELDALSTRFAQAA
ncbi:hypothetical protein [Streptomyces sp. NBC_00932]|uniref:hypothetical protein n=1 Tax=Streptomyces sp. NBC_00932 TaxID=2903690 RepID=UPI00386359C0|nr:hypothetical protein OG221_27705 [Streptomyces sp. NBC_00932]